MTKFSHQGLPSIMLTIDTNKKPLVEIPQHVTHVAPQCYPLQICVFKSGEDPCMMLLLCPNMTETSPSDSGTNVSALTIGPLTENKIQMRIYNRPLKVDDWFLVTTGISGNSNNWLLMTEQAAAGQEQDCVICLGPRPIMKIVPAVVSPNCTLDLMTNDNPSANCTKWDKVHPLSPPSKNKPLFDKNVALLNWTCIQLNGSKQLVGKIPAERCIQNISAPKRFTPKSRADVWWWCGEDKIYDKLPKNTTGTCALISLLLPTSVLPYSAEEVWEMHQNFIPGTWKRDKRSMPWHSDNDPTYIDAIGVPRGVPDEYKLVDQVAAGFENIPVLSALFPVTPNKNVDRINYIHYNVQKLGNYTEAGLQAVHEQLSATSLMTFQNRIALDMLLAEKHGVCALFGDQCCTFIPNNTATGGKLTRALEGLRTMNKRMKDQSGVDTSMWDSWLDVFGKWKSLITSLLLSLAVFAALLTLCGCCCIPCLRALLNRLITTAITPDFKDGMMPLLADEHDSLEENLLAMFTDEPDSTV